MYREPRQFVEFQPLPTRGAQSIETFVIAGGTYLAVANRHDDLKVYKWNGAEYNDQFAEFQSIPTLTAYDLEPFKIAGEPYLAVANHRDGNNFKISSKIYKWNGAKFAEFQSIPTRGARDWEAFEIAGETYLAVANKRDNDNDWKINCTNVVVDGTKVVGFVNAACDQLGEAGGTLVPDPQFRW